MYAWEKLVIYRYGTGHNFMHLLEGMVFGTSPLWIRGHYSVELA
jgi:hypothetical protein